MSRYPLPFEEEEAYAIARVLSTLVDLFGFDAEEDSAGWHVVVYRDSSPDEPITRLHTYADVRDFARAQVGAEVRNTPRAGSAPAHEAHVRLCREYGLEPLEEQALYWFIQEECGLAHDEVTTDNIVSLTQTILAQRTADLMERMVFADAARVYKHIQSTHEEGL